MCVIESARVQVPVNPRICFTARRWVVERSHSWIHWFRRKLDSASRRSHKTRLSFLHFACGVTRVSGGSGHSERLFVPNSVHLSTEAKGRRNQNVDPAPGRLSTPT